MGDNARVAVIDIAAAVIIRAASTTTVNASTATNTTTTTTAITIATTTTTTTTTATGISLAIVTSNAVSLSFPSLCLSRCLRSSINGAVMFALVGIDSESHEQGVVIALGFVVALVDVVVMNEFVVSILSDLLTMVALLIVEADDEVFVFKRGDLFCEVVVMILLPVNDRRSRLCLRFAVHTILRSTSVLNLTSTEYCVQKKTKRSMSPKTRTFKQQ
uniref:Uncharacterized protein n=1 Tax=Glossina brevipalpis TaxID=37001 RepID=A0A1A9W9C8_9MUSC